MTRSRRVLPLLPLVGLAAFAAAAAAQTTPAPANPPTPDTGSVIFVHADGAAIPHWEATRLVTVGPDGELAWDRLERVGVYRGHLTNAVASSSHGGATAHAYGIKVPYESYGMNGDLPLTALSGAHASVLLEARDAGLATALVNSGHIAEPGTGVFAASAASRAHVDTITRQIVENGVDIILTGGERLMFPYDVRGHFGLPGVRQDGMNMIGRAKALGYAVVYTLEELRRLPPETPKVLGLFAPLHTFNDRPEEALEALGMEMYRPGAPTVAELVHEALRFLEARNQRFLLVAEEEGSDNFANSNNAAGTLEALERADAAIDEALAFADRHPEALVITTADSDAGGLQVWPVGARAAYDIPLPERTANGAPLDGKTGTGGPPFVARPAANGVQFRFGIAWAARADLMGGIVARAHGRNADLLPANVDNTDIYRMIYATLFGTWLP